MVKEKIGLTGLFFSRGPVNEDVFAAPVTAEGKAMDSDILDITEQIHRLLVQVRQNRKKTETSFCAQQILILRRLLPTEIILSCAK